MSMSQVVIGFLVWWMSSVVYAYRYGRYRAAKTENLFKMMFAASMARTAFEKTNAR